ncbi:MAG: N-acetylmuramoyl-L-alanine amidase [Eubacteriales bacterium]|nr:N-acetylmuramoyl-L-alanine amidase [Eubacteriales bacterium]
MKKKTGKLLLAMLLIVTGIFSWKGTSFAASEPGIAWLYLSPAGTSQAVVVSMAEVSPTSAALCYKIGGQTTVKQATEIKGKNLAFLLDESSLSSANLVSLEVTVSGQTWTINLQQFRKASDTESVTVSKEDTTLSSTQLSLGTTGVVAENTSQIRSALNAAASQVPTVKGTVKASGTIVIVLDPGHGGWDSGASRTWNGVTYKESEIALKIAKATKTELETYSGVKVYLTRSSDVYVDLSDRVEYAASVGATALISQHINSTATDSTTATGAEVMVSSGNYRPIQAEETKAIAEAILAQLSSIGFTNRGLVYRLSETGNTYENGELADYYAIVRQSVLAGFPGMIVEHGFVSNPSDCEKYYGSNAKIKALGVADATAIANYYGLKKKTAATTPTTTVKAGWIRKNDKVYYQYSDGTLATGVTNIKGKYYYFSSKGVRQTGWKVVDGKRYYFSPKNYAAVRGWKTINGKRYYFNSKGVCQTGMFTVGSYTYYANSKGVRKTGWIKISGNWYYFKPTNGRMIAGRSAKIKGTWYTFGSSGVWLGY